MIATHRSPGVFSAAARAAAPRNGWFARTAPASRCRRKIDNVRVRAGDRVIFRTAGGGGWGDPLERDPMRTRNDVARKLMSEAKAREEYGVVLTGPVSSWTAGPLMICATSMRRNRKDSETVRLWRAQSRQRFAPGRREV